MFSSALLLFQHDITHIAVSYNSLKRRPYVCTICGKGFTRKDSLQTHFHLHTGEKPYSCSICCSAFSSRASLKFHMKTHAYVLYINCLPFKLLIYFIVLYLIVLHLLHQNIVFISYCHFQNICINYLCLSHFFL